MFLWDPFKTNSLSKIGLGRNYIIFHLSRNFGTVPNFGLYVMIIFDIENKEQVIAHATTFENTFD